MPAHAIVGDGQLSLHTVSTDVTPPETRVTPLVEVQLSGARLVGSVRVTLPIERGVPLTAVVGVSSESASGKWSLVGSRVVASKRELVLTTPHLSIFGGIRVDADAVLHRTITSLTNFFTGRAGAAQPTCSDESAARANGVTISSDSGDLVKWCFGTSDGHRRLTIVNNRAGPVSVTYASSWSAGNVTGAGISFESLGRYLSSKLPAGGGKVVVIGAGDSVVLSLPDNLPYGASIVQLDILSWAFSGFDVAVSTALAVYSEFLRVSGTADDILRGALTNGEAASAGGFLSCMNGVFGGDVDPRKSIADAGFEPAMQALRVAVKCGFDTVRDWILKQGLNVFERTALGVVSAALGFVVAGLELAFTGARDLFDSLTGHAMYRIAVGSNVTLGRPWGPYQQGYGHVAPDGISNGGDPTGIVDDVHWQSWGMPQATATGTSDYVGPGQDVAGGTQESVSVVAFDLGMCAGKLMYRAIEWFFPQHGERFDAKTYINICTGDYVFPSPDSDATVEAALRHFLDDWKAGDPQAVALVGFGPTGYTGYEFRFDGACSPAHDGTGSCEELLVPKSGFDTIVELDYAGADGSGIHITRVVPQGDAG